MRTIYLPSYDQFNEVLEYSLPEGTFSIMERQQFVDLSLEFTLGAFTREGQQVSGVFGSPSGPVFFLDRRQVVGCFGHTVASAAEQMFLLRHSAPGAEEIEFALRYRERDGLGANPYDIEVEDTDLFAMMAAGTRREQFFRAYTRDWLPARKLQCQICMSLDDEYEILRRLRLALPAFRWNDGDSSWDKVRVWGERADFKIRVYRYESPGPFQLSIGAGTGAENRTVLEALRASVWTRPIA